MEIEKAYFTLPEILDRWSISDADLLYLAENDKLRLSVRVFNLPVEFGDYEETMEGERFTVPWEQSRYNGVLDLHTHDVFQLFRFGEVRVSYFRTPRAAYACLWGEAEDIPVIIDDLLLRREERDRFEAETGFPGGEADPKALSFSSSADTKTAMSTGDANAGRRQGPFTHSTDFAEVTLNGQVYLFTGYIQRNVVRILHEAAGNNQPWLSGKAVLDQAGSTDMKMRNLFRRHPSWGTLIVSNGRGLYRLRTA